MTRLSNSVPMTASKSIEGMTKCDVCGNVDVSSHFATIKVVVHHARFHTTQIARFDICEEHDKGVCNSVVSVVCHKGTPHILLPVERELENG